VPDIVAVTVSSWE